MTFDELKKTWQSQQTGFKLTIDSDMLLKEVKRNKKHFASAIFWRDVREAGLCVILSIFFLYVGIRLALWPLFLLAALILGVGLFLVVDRAFQKRKAPKSTESLGGCIEDALAQVNHQIRLLKSVLWWYLLPPGIGMTISCVYLAYLLRRAPTWCLLIPVASFIVMTIVLWRVYHLNQCAVRKELLPRRAELEQLLNALTTANDQSAS
ncbi:MAG TPA: hypothetical protein VMX13_13005 [Sedimentisphaerales bacterium]|nr:hypothetical protein [Sedimentisphaerales bacterium]